MRKIKVFLASSDELIKDREAFEREMYRKSKVWVGKGVFLHLDIWEDLSGRMSTTRSQDDYNVVIRENDLFVLLASTKVGMYTAEEFEAAFGAFQSTKKPFIFTYFKDITTDVDPSLNEFKLKLKKLEHFYSSYQSFDDLWNQFNKELDQLLLADFAEFQHDRANKILGTVPVNPEILIGRDTDLDSIREMITQSDQHSLLLVNGAGGIGKTTAASAYYHKYFDEYAHLIWIVAENGIKQALLSLAFELQILSEDGANEKQRLNKLHGNCASSEIPAF